MRPLWGARSGSPRKLCWRRVFAYTLLQGLTHVTDSLSQIVVPGSAALELKRGLTYTVFSEQQSVVNGKVFSTTESIEGLACSVRSLPKGIVAPIGQPGTVTSYQGWRKIRPLRPTIHGSARWQIRILLRLRSEHSGAQYRGGSRHRRSRENLPHHHSEPGSAVRRDGPLRGRTSRRDRQAQSLHRHPMGAESQAIGDSSPTSCMAGSKTE